MLTFYRVDGDQAAAEPPQTKMAQSRIGLRHFHSLLSEYQIALLSPDIFWKIFPYPNEQLTQIHLIQPLDKIKQEIPIAAISGISSPPKAKWSESE
jgi:hypothetical protein